MYSAWQVAIQMNVTQNNTTNVFNNMQRQVQSVNKNVLLLNAHLVALGMGMKAGIDKAGAALTGFATDGIKRAGDLEQAFTNIFNTLGTNTENGKQQLQNMVMTVSGMTKQSAVTIAQEMMVAGQSGLSQKQILTLFPRIAKFADLQTLGPGHMDPIEAIKVATQIGHLEGAYSVKDMGTMLERLNKLGYTQPESMNKVLTQAKYFIPSARKLGMSIDDTMDITAMMGQTGLLSGRGGTGVAGVIAGMLAGPSLHSVREVDKRAALTGLGVVDRHGRNNFVDGQGHIEFSKLIEHLSAVAAKERPDLFYMQLTKAFSATSIPFLQNLTRKSVQEQIASTADRTKHMGSIDTMFAGLTKNFNYNAGLLRTNMENLSTTIFLPLLKIITPWIGKVADEVGRLVAYVSAHPKLGVTIAVATLVGIGTAMALSAAIAVGSMLALINSIRMLSVATGTASLGVAGRTAVGAIGAAAGVGGMVARFFAPLTFALRALASPFMLAGAVALRFAGTIATVGMRFLPVIGWVLAVSQALLFFAQHPKEVGRWVGEVIGFFRYHLIPETIKAIQSWIPQIVAGFRSLMSNIMNVINPANWGKDIQGLTAKGGLIDGIKDIFHKAATGVQEGINDQHYHDNRNTTIHVHGAGDPHAVAKAVMQEHNRTAAFVQRAGGGSTSTPRISQLATQGLRL